MNLDEVKAKIELSQGDITKQEVDVIVNSSNTDLILGSGVGGEIGRSGGEVVQEECDRLGSVPLGGAVETTAGNLPARYILHAASAEVGHFATERDVAKATRSALARAEQLQARSIAFPALGTGAAAFPVHRCARVMLDVVARHLAGGSKIESVRFVLFDEETLETFREAFERMSDAPRSSSRSRGRRSRGGRGGSGKQNAPKGEKGKNGGSRGGRGRRDSSQGEKGKKD